VTKNLKKIINTTRAIANYPTVKRGLKDLGMKEVLYYYWKAKSISCISSKYISTHQAPYMFYPGLHSQPYWDTSKFSWVKLLEDNYLQIKEEMMAVLPFFQPYRIIENNKFLKEGGGLCTSIKEKPGWMMYYFHHLGLVAENINRCPKTSQLLSSIHNLRNTFTCFSALSKKTGLNVHCGPSNALLRCHLAVHIPEPEKAHLTVAGENRRWEEGKVMIFDDSFKHSVTYSSDFTRVVLFFDVWHPDWTPEEVEQLNSMDQDLSTNFMSKEGSFINRMQTALHTDANSLVNCNWFIPKTE